MPRGAPSWTSNFYEMFNDFFLILRSSESLERPSGTTNKGVLRLPRLSVQIDKITQKTSQKPSFSIPKSSQNRVQDAFKAESESTANSYSIPMRFGMPKWCHVGAMLTPKTAQNSIKIDVRNGVTKRIAKGEKKPPVTKPPGTNQQGYKLY